MSQSGAGSKLVRFPGMHVAEDGARLGGYPPSTPPNNLPTPATAFIGRAALVDEICRLVIEESVRILTLTGPGGVGKTRVAFKACEALLPEFDDGIFFVNLASITDPSLVLPAIAGTLGLKESGTIPIAVTLATFLRDRSMLLLLDNFEQVVEAGPEVTRLLAGAPGVRLMITSRIPLRLYGEYEYPVPPMDLPEDEGRKPALSAAKGSTPFPLKEMAASEAIQLFAARGKEVRPGFVVTGANARAVADICRRLDGLPLALELAAARLRLFSPESLLKRLDRALPLLVGGARDLPARQQTLRNAIEWSYNLLGEREQQLFALMSVFVGGCTLEAAQQVWKVANESVETKDEEGELEEQMESLTAQNLLRQREQADGEPRFWMLETIREYALEKLSGGGGLKKVQQAHALFFLELVEAGKEANSRGEAHDEWLARLGGDTDNIRAALRWLLDQGEGEMALRMALALAWFWTARGYLVEGSRRLDEALALSDGSPAALRADAFWQAGWLAMSQNDFARTKLYAEESLNLYGMLGDKRGMAKAFSHLGVVAAEQEDYSLALSRFEQSLAVWRELDHAMNVAMLVGNLSFLALYEGDYGRAISYGEESLTVNRAIRNGPGIMGAGINLGLGLLHAGDVAAGMALHEEMLAAAESSSSKKDMALAHNYLGLALLLLGDHGKANPHYRESLILFEELGNRFGIARSLVGLAGVAAGEGRMRQAAILSGAANALIEAARGKPVPAERELDERTVKKARAQLEDAAFTEARAQGQAMTQDQSIAFALRNEVPQLSIHAPTPLESPAGPTLIAQPPLPTSEITARELEVLRLIAAGLTNKEIAEHLVLSHRTVEAHLYSIFNKLDVTTRSAATRYAMEHGLTDK